MGDGTLDLASVTVMRMIGSNTTTGQVATQLSQWDWDHQTSHMILHWLVHCMDGIMLIVLYEQEEAHTTVQVHSKEWKTKPGVQGLPASVKCLGMQWFGTRRNISSEAKHKLLYFTTPTMTNEAECLVVLIGCQRQHVPFLRTLLLHVYWWHGLKWALNKNCKWPYCLGHMTQQSLWS